MPLPVGIPLVTVTGNYTVPASGAGELSGSVTFTPVPDRVASAAYGVILLGSYNATLSASGSFTARLVSTDVGAFVWRMDENIAGLPPQSRNLTLPASGSPVDLVAFPATDAPAATYTVITGPRGPQGIQGPQGASGSSLGALLSANNLSDLANPGTARSSLGLGNSATRTVGATAGTVADGGDSRFTDARTPAVHAATHASGGTDPVTPAAIGAVAAAALDTSVAYPPSYRMPRTPQPAAILAEWQAGHGFTATGGTFTANDVSSFIRGTQAAKLVTPGDSVFYFVTGAISAVDSTGKALRIVVRVDDITTLNTLQFDLATDTTWANGWTWTAQGTSGGSNYITSGDWVMMTLGFADATALGTGPRSGLAALRVRVRDTGVPVTVHLQAAELVADGSAVFPNGCVVLTADDVYQSFVDLGKPRLDLYGYPCTEFVIADRVGLAGRMTLQGLQDLQATGGWELASHAYADAVHGATFNGVTAAALDADARAMKAYAVANGFRAADLIAYPKGQNGKTSDGASITAILQKYFAVGLTTVNKTREVFPFSDPWRIRRISSMSSFAGSYPPASITGAGGDLDKVKANGGVLFLTFHQIVTAAPTDSTMLLQSDLNAIIDAIAAKGIPVLTVGEYVRYALTSASSGAGVDTSTMPRKEGVPGSPGASTLASPADHIHPRTWWAAEDHGYLTWTFDPTTCNSSGTAPAFQTLQMTRVHLPAPATVTNIAVFVQSVTGVALTAGQNFAALYTSGGTLLSTTADQTTNFSSTGTRPMALTTPQTNLAAGDYYVAFFINGTTAPTFAKANASFSVINANLTSSTARFATAAGGLTTAMPASAGTMSSTSNGWWAALS